MQQGLKQRLVGALVILALVVIFLPMLLQGPVERTRVDVPIQVPPEPDAPTDETLPPPDFTERPSPAEDIVTTVPRDDSGAPAGAGGQGGGDADQAGDANNGADVPEPQGRVVAGGASGQDDGDANGDATGQASRAEGGGGASSEARTPEGRPGSWVIQLGAFSEAANAERLIERLTEAGFEDGYRDRSEVDGSVLHRVRVGPIPTRSDAETLRERLEDEVDISGILVPR